MFPASEKLKAVQREIGYRKRVYPRLIADGKLAQHTADQQLRIFEEIAADYQAQAEKERLI